MWNLEAEGPADLNLFAYERGYEFYSALVLDATDGAHLCQQRFGGPDFLLNTTGDTSSTGATPLKAILDAKYIPGYNKRLEVEPRYIGQLAGYARDKTLLRLLHIDTTNEDTVPILPCVILYPLPTRAVSSSPSSSSSLSFSYAPIPSDNTVKFFRCPVPVPLLPFPPR